MRRFLTLVGLLGLALPAGISISGCIRNPAGDYCNGLGYGPKVTDLASITLQPQIAGISLAYGQTTQIQTPSPFACHGDGATVPPNQYVYATTNNQLVDVSPTGLLCAGTWNRNTGGGIADFTVCNFPNPLPSTGGLPYSVAYITATAQSVSSNPVAVYIHAPVTSVSLLTTSVSSSLPQQCYSQNQQAVLDAEACYVSNGIGYELCAPPSVTSGFKCPGGAVPAPNIVASASFNGPSLGSNGSIVSSNYVSGGSITGTSGQTCKVSNFNNGSTGATGTLLLSGSNTITPGAVLMMTSGGTGATAPPTTATFSSGTASCSGTIQLSQIVGSPGQYCYLTSFNQGSSGAKATVPITAANTIATGTQLQIASGGTGAAAPPTLAVLSSGTASCSGPASVTTTLTPVPSCGSSIGTLNFSVSNGTVASITPATLGNPQSTITALQPGTTAITAVIAQSASSAGYFSTCPPASIKVTLANGATKGVITQGVSQNLSATVLDTNLKPITGLTLQYESTNPIDISATGSGSISAAFPGSASVYAICEPGVCNPAPINEYGLYGTGLPLSSNPVSITVPGVTSDFVWFAAPGQSQYFTSVELLTGNPGSTVRLPFVPNSMVMDQDGNNLYFGSPRELMIYSTVSNALTRQDTGVPGIVLAVSPNSNQVVINDQIRGLFYLYNAAGGTSTSFGGMGVAAAWTPDSNTLYIVDNAAAGANHTNTLYVYNVNVGWSTYDLTASGGSQNVAVTVPAIGAYLAGGSTVAHTWCPSGTVGNNASIQFYPQSDSVPVATSVLGATTDGAHMLGVSLNGASITLDDIGVAISATPLCPENTATTPQTMTPLSTNPTLNGVLNLAGVTNATAVNQVVTGTAPTTASTTTAAPIAFVTYSTPSASTTAVQLPYYLPQASGTGLAGYVKFADNSSATPPTAPLFGAFSPDNSIFFVSTAGDNQIHFISIPTNVNTTTAPPTDTQQFSPALPACTPVSAGGNDAGCLYPVAPPANTLVPATAIAVKPRSVT